MSDESGTDNPLDVLAEEFVARFRRGERPALTEFTNRHPELAEDIRDLFPTLVMMEEARPDHADASAECDTGGPRSPAGQRIERLGDYRILREVGRGGMGIVYEAEQESLGRHVALKVLPALAMLDPRQLQRFQREARAAAGLHHTNIVPVFGVGEHQGLYYYVMQFIPGLGLDQVLDELQRLRTEHKSDAPAMENEDPSPAKRTDSSLAHRVSMTEAGLLSAARIATSLIGGVAGGDHRGLAHLAPGTFAPMVAEQNVPVPLCADDPPKPEIEHESAEGSKTRPQPRPSGASDSATFHVRSPSSDPSGSDIKILARDTTSLSTSGLQYWQSVARIGVQVADAIDYAFGQGVLHRDIKPSNLLLDAHGTVWVTDFGLAKAVDSDDLTRTGDVVGTLRYLAPERLRGEVNLRGDLYSLGITLYEMLTLRPPFLDHDRSRLVRRIVDEEPTRPRHIDATIPRDLETIVMKAIAKDPVDRYRSAAEMAEDLRQFLDDKPIAARPIGQLERSWRWCRRNPRIALLLGSVALLLVIVAAGSSTAAVWLKHERDLARASEQRAATAEKARRRELYRAYLGEARASYITGRQGQRVNGIDAIKSILAAFPPDEMTDDQRAELRDDAISYLALYDLREAARLPRSWERLQVDFNDTLEVYAHPQDGVGGTVVSRLDGAGSSIQLPFGLAEPPSINTELRVFSDSGRWLAATEVINSPEFDRRRRVRIWDWQAARVVFDEPAPLNGLRIAFHPDDQQFMAFDGDAALHLYSLTTGKEVSRSPERFSHARGSFSHDGKLFAVTSRESTAEIIDPTTWQTVATIPEVGPTVCVAWNPVEPYLVFGGINGRLYQWHPASRAGHFLSGGHGGAVFDLRFSPDGRVLASSGYDQMMQLRSTKGDRLLLTMPGQVLRFSRDGKRLAAQINHDLIVFEPVAARAVTSIVEHVDTADFSPDGNWLAMGYFGGVLLYSANSLERQGELALDHCGPVAFHPSGRNLLTYGIFSHLWNWPLTPLQKKGSGVFDREGPTNLRSVPGAAHQRLSTFSSVDANTWQLGPPQPVHPRLLKRELLGPEPQRSGRSAAWSQDGRVLAIADYRYDRVFVTDANAEAPPRKIAELPGVARVAVSPDGQWIAGAGQHFKRVCVWHTDDGQKMLDLPDYGQMAFSPDGKWFATSSVSRVLLYRVGEWTLEREFKIDEPPNFHSAPIAFQGNGPLLAMAVSSRQVRLFDYENGKVVANLTHVDRANLIWLSFSADGARLAVTRSGVDVAVWDLHLVRNELAEIGIACEGLPNQHATSTDAEPDLKIDPGELVSQADHGAMTWRLLALNEARHGRWPDAIEDVNISFSLLPGDARQERAELLTLRGQYNLSNQNARAAREDWQQAISLAPQMSAAIRPLARLHILGPLEHRDAGQALGLIAGLAADPNPQPEDLLILGIAQVRLGRYEQGLVTLQNVADAPATRPYTLFFVALAYHGLGQTQLATESLAQAKASHDEVVESLGAEERDELALVRTEVESRLRE